MDQARKLWTILLGGLLTVTGCYATGPSGGHDALPLPMSCISLAPPVAQARATNPNLPSVPSTQPEDRPLPINLPAALQLANVRAIDVAAAAARIRVSAAALEQAQVLWLPTVTFGADYFRHDGIVQDATTGAVQNDSHQGIVLGMGPAVNLDIGNAIFAPLVARQQLAARKADLQAASNDTLLAVSDAYFNVQQARGELAGAIVATQRTEELVRRTKKLAPALVPELEIDRAEAELALCQENELFARERWKVASAELLRVLRLEPSAQVEPVEPPQLRLDLIDLRKPIDDLIPIGLTNRPELASQQAQVQATLVLLKREKMRPLIPSLLIRGFSTPASGTLAGSYAIYGVNGELTTTGFRSDIDVQLLWQLENLGFGNVAKVHQRQAENHAAVIDLLRIEDRVAAEVVQAHAQAQLASRRVEVTEKRLRSAVQSANKNLVALGQTKGAGPLNALLVRPQEAVASIQALSQAYVGYYGAVADANRAQFRLYRALGQPAQCLLQDQSVATLSAPVNVSPATPTAPTVEPLHAPRPLPPDAGKAASSISPARFGVPNSSSN
jgi:outer membrane protein TolC